MQMKKFPPLKKENDEGNHPFGWKEIRGAEIKREALKV